ncbi:MAG: YraN family protein [Desulfobacterales bacterium]|nr:YraN family protein [Desulfobacterales bacterium]
MTTAGYALGRAGEKTAARYLKSRGYTLVKQNYKHKTFEIDIIAKDKDVLCFVEVKTRSNIRKALPREAVSRAKQKKMILGATTYLKEKKLVNQRVRFDVVEVVYSNGSNPPDITHIQNAFSGV